MNKTVVKYKQAKKLKQLGFKEPCNFWYYNKSRKLIPCTRYHYDPFLIMAPTLEQAKNWLHENFHYWIEVQIESPSFDQYPAFRYTVYTTYGIKCYESLQSYQHTYDALSDGIDKVLDLMNHMLK